MTSPLPPLPWKSPEVIGIPGSQRKLWKCIHESSGKNRFWGSLSPYRGWRLSTYVLLFKCNTAQPGTRIVRHFLRRTFVLFLGGNTARSSADCFSRWWTNWSVHRFSLVEPLNSSYTCEARCTVLLACLLAVVPRNLPATFALLRAPPKSSISLIFSPRLFSLWQSDYYSSTTSYSTKLLLLACIFENEPEKKSETLARHRYYSINSIATSTVIITSTRSGYVPPVSRA